MSSSASAGRARHAGEPSQAPQSLLAQRLLAGVGLIAALAALAVLAYGAFSCLS